MREQPKVAGFRTLPNADNGEDGNEGDEEVVVEATMTMMTTSWRRCPWTRGGGIT
jgi:hypothetical protein